MAYRKIDPRLWDDERFVGLTAVQKLFWLYVLTGPHATSLPGLWIVGIGELVDGLRFPERSVREALAVLEGAGMLIHNPRVRLIRVPNAPKYNRPENARVLKAWFRLWQSIPDCQQKFDHLTSLQSAVSAPASAEDAEDTAPLGATWLATFGALTVPRGYTLPDGFASGRVREPLANGSIAPALVSGSLDLLSAEIPEGTVTAREPEGVDDAAAAVLGCLRALPRCEALATPRQAAIFAGRIHAGGIPIANALEALTDGAFKSESEREQGRVRTRNELVAFLMGCVGRASRGAARNGKPAEVQRSGWSREDAARNKPATAEGDGF
jgi:hypothetical protein